MGGAARRRVDQAPGNLVGAVVGGGGLGFTINRAIMIQDGDTLLKATLALILMSIIFDVVMSIIERKLDYNNK